MLKKTFLLLVCFIGLIILVSTLHCQGSKKTITLPSGEVIWDLNGEWDAFVEHYGSWERLGSDTEIVKIMQEGSSFVGIRMADDKWRNLKGTEAIRGELDKSGFKKVQLIAWVGHLDSTGEISEDGNKMIIDEGKKVKVTYTGK